MKPFKLLFHDIYSFNFSEYAHSSVEKAGILGSVQLRLLEPDEHFSLRGETLLAAIQQDKAQGLIPFHVS
jgi:glutamate/tyrosine decarboxylase-like PLP-dependent enzyme